MPQRPVRSGSAFRQSLCSPVLDDYWRDVVGMRVWPWTWADPRVHHPAVDADLEACAGVRVATPVRGLGTRSGAIHIREFLRHLNCGALCWAFLVEPKPQVVAAAGPAGDDVGRLEPGISELALMLVLMGFVVQPVLLLVRVEVQETEVVGHIIVADLAQNDEVGDRGVLRDT